MAVSIPPENLLNNLEEVFCCYICMGRLRDTRLCPKCSKMCCFQCIRRWLIEQKPSCPHCRSSLLLHELVKCRWVDDLLPRLDSQARKEALSKDQCATHSEQLSVYCVTCRICVCHQCALWAGEHKEHKFQPVTEIYETHKTELYDEIKNLKRRLAEIVDCISDIDRQLSSFNQERDNQLKQISKVMKDITSRLDMQISSQITKLRHQQSTLQKDSDIVEQKIGEVMDKIETSVKSEFISSFPDLLQELIRMSSQLSKPHTANLTFLGKELEFTNELVPAFCDKEFVIEDFTSCKSSGSPIYSPPLTLHGQTWKLKVYPNGNGVFRDDFLSVFLELSQGFTGSAKYEYRVSMVHTARNADRTVYREFLSDFEPGECWGYNRFYRLEHLLSKGYLDSVDDKLTLQFAVRSPTFYHDSLQQSKHVSCLTRQVESLQERLRVAEQTDSSQEVSILCRSSQEKEESDQPQPQVYTNGLTFEQLDRTFLVQVSDDGSEASGSALWHSDRESNSSDIQEGFGGFNYDLAAPDGHESVDIPGPDCIEQELVMPLKRILGEMTAMGAAEANELSDMDMTLVSNPDYSPAVTHPEETLLDGNLLDCSSEGDGASIHSLESPPAENLEWNSAGNMGVQLSVILSQPPAEESAQEATRFTDSLPSSLPNIQATILACLRDVSNNPLIGLSASASSLSNIQSFSEDATPLDITRLNSYSSHSETDEEGADFNTNWVDETDSQQAASEHRE